MSDRSDDEGALDGLMDRLADGDRKAFDPLFRALYPRALRVCRAKLDVSCAEDVAQASLVRVFARASEFERGRAVLPWFYAILANEVHTRSRANRARAARTADEGAGLLVSTSVDPERLLAERELHDALRAAIASLDEEQSATIASVIEEAPRPAITPSAFRKRVSRAYARLRVLLGGFHGS